MVWPVGKLSPTGRARPVTSTPYKVGLQVLQVGDELGVSSETWKIPCHYIDNFALLNSQPDTPSTMHNLNADSATEYGALCDI